MSEPNEVQVPDIDSLITLKQAAEETGIHPGKIRKWTLDGKLRAWRLPQQTWQKLYIEREQLAEVVAEYNRPIRVTGKLHSGPYGGEKNRRAQ